jgi:hypothetical protein
MVRVFGFGKERVAGMRQSCPKAGFHDPTVLAKPIEQAWCVQSGWGRSPGGGEIEPTGNGCGGAILFISSTRLVVVFDVSQPVWT